MSAAFQLCRSASIRSSRRRIGARGGAGHLLSSASRSLPWRLESRWRSAPSAGPTAQTYRADGIRVRGPAGWFFTRRHLTGVTWPMQRFVVSSFRIPSVPVGTFVPPQSGVLAQILEQSPPISGEHWKPRPADLRFGRFRRHGDVRRTAPGTSSFSVSRAASYMRSPGSVAVRRQKNGRRCCPSSNDCKRERGRSRPADRRGERTRPTASAPRLRGRCGRRRGGRGRG